MNTLGERLRYLLATKNIKAISLAEKLNRPRATISNYMVDRTFPNAEFFKELEEFIPDANLHWLLTGKGEMLFKVQNTEISTEDSRVSQLEQQLAEMKKQQDAIMMAFSGFTNLTSTSKQPVEPVESVRNPHHKRQPSFSGAVRQKGNFSYPFLISRTGSC